MSRNISQLHPRLQAKMDELKNLCSGQGLILGIGECVRTVEEQDELYAQGRTKPGNIVTWARGATYSSQHQWGIAFDFFKNVPGHAFDDLPFFEKVGNLAKGIGLGWGGDWRPDRDRPHLYLPDWGDTPSKLKQQYGTPTAFFASWNVIQSGKLMEDGYFGPKTVLALQKYFGTEPDGYLSDQYIGYRSENPGITGGVEWVSHPSTGSACVKKVQNWVGSEADGFLGPNTIKALQLKLGTEVDGTLSAPSQCVRKLQSFLNQNG